jgi:hypothetical protein
VEHFIAEDLFEDGARRRIVIHDIAINRETAGGSFFCHVQEGEQAMVGFSFDGQVVEAVTAGKGARVEQPLGTRGAQLKEGGAALTEQIGMAQLVDGVFQVQSAQERVRGDFRGAQDIASATAFNFGEREQLAHTPVKIAPHPPVNRPQYPIDTRASGNSHRGNTLAYAQERLNLSLSPVPRVRWSKRLTARVTAEIAVASIGGALLACALVANQRWLDRHFLPSWFLPRQWYVLLESFVRLVMAALGVSLALFGRPRVGRFAARAPTRVLHAAIAVVLALGASELVLRRAHLRAAEWLMPDEEPRRRRDSRLGWTFVPARSGHNTIGGRVIDYAFDPAGYRVRRVEEPVDPEQPTILFTGESVMFGEGLTWEESVPAQVGATMGMQSANLAVHGFASDQAYLRLQMELPRFRRPVAVVSLFMTALFGRNLDDDRPHLGPGLVWLPGAQHSRLASIAKLLVPYRSDETVERGVRVTRAVLRATVDLARAHGADALIVVPQFGREPQVEQALRRRILDDIGLPYVWVEIDAAWRLPWDRHPNPPAAHAIAAAVAARLRGR